MTTNEMHHYTNRLKEIRSIKNTDLRNARLANLMTDLETRYLIPAFSSSHRIETVDPFVLQLYQTVSDERS